MTNNQAPLTLLRESVRQLDQYEKLALATFLTGTSNPKFESVGVVTAPPSENLAKACELAKTFPSATKIFFAIELLELQIDRHELEEGDGLPDPSDYEGEEYYSSDAPLLGEEEDEDDGTLYDPITRNELIRGISP